MARKQTKRYSSISKSLRRAIQTSDLPLNQLAKKMLVNVKTVRKWKKRSDLNDLPKGPKHRGSRVLTTEQEMEIVSFRRKELLPLDACLSRLKKKIPDLTRSALQRCFVRHGVSDLKKAHTWKTRSPRGVHPSEVRQRRLSTCQGIDLITGKLIGNRYCLH